MDVPQYPKIHSIFKRDLATGEFLSEYSRPEFEYLADCDWVWTEKVDGMNIRVSFDGTELAFRGRTDRAQIPVPLLAKLTETFTMGQMDEVFQDLPPDTTVVLYGEGYGRKIQKAGSSYIPDGVGFILFDVRIGRWWLRLEDVEDIAKRLAVPVVPVVDVGPLSLAVAYMKAGGFSSEVAREATTAEGLVLRPKVELFGRSGERVITKVKVKDYFRR